MWCMYMYVHHIVCSFLCFNSSSPWSSPMPCSTVCTVIMYINYVSMFQQNITTLAWNVHSSPPYHKLFKCSSKRRLPLNQNKNRPFYIPPFPQLLSRPIRRHTLDNDGMFKQKIHSGNRHPDAQAQEGVDIVSHNNVCFEIMKTCPVYFLTGCCHHVGPMLLFQIPPNRQARGRWSILREIKLSMTLRTNTNWIR